MAEQIRNVFISHKHEDDDGLQEIKRLVLQRQFIWQGDFRDQFEPDSVLPRTYRARSLVDKYEWSDTIFGNPSL